MQQQDEETPQESPQAGGLSRTCADNASPTGVIGAMPAASPAAAAAAEAKPGNDLLAEINSRRIATPKVEPHQSPKKSARKSGRKSSQHAPAVEESPQAADLTRTCADNASPTGVMGPLPAASPGASPAAAAAAEAKPGNAMLAEINSRRIATPKVEPHQSPKKSARKSGRHLRFRSPSSGLSNHPFDASTATPEVAADDLVDGWTPLKDQEEICWENMTARKLEHEQGYEQALEDVEEVAWTPVKEIDELSPDELPSPAEPAWTPEKHEPDALEDITFTYALPPAADTTACVELETDVDTDTENIENTDNEDESDCSVHQSDGEFIDDAAQERSYMHAEQEVADTAADDARPASMASVWQQVCPGSPASLVPAVSWSPAAKSSARKSSRRSSRKLTAAAQASPVKSARKRVGSVSHEHSEVAEVRHDYNESHMADAGSHTHLSVEHTHSEVKDAEPVDVVVDVTETEAEVDADTVECEQELAEAKTEHCKTEVVEQEQQEEEQEQQQEQQEQKEEQQQGEEQELEDFSTLRVVDLRERLAELELPTDGKKADLIHRLEEHYGKGAEVAETCEADGEQTKADTPPEETSEQPTRVKRERKQVTRLEAGPATANWSEYATEAQTDEAAVEENEDAVEDLGSLTVAVLKKRLVELGMPTDGKKAVLVERLQDALTNGVPNVDEVEEAADEEQVEYLTKETIKTWTVAELKAELAARDLPTTGVKATLLKRLAQEL